jgi:hypothetical protein
VRAIVDGFGDREARAAALLEANQLGGHRASIIAAGRGAGRRGYTNEA